MGGVIGKTGPLPIGMYIPSRGETVNGQVDTVDTIGSLPIKQACQVNVAVAAANVPTPIAKIAVGILGVAACESVGPDSKVGSQPPPNPLKGEDGTT